VRLTEISENDGTPAHLIDDESEIDDRWFDGVDSVLVTAGASAPEDLVDRVLKYLIENHGGEVDVSDLFEEDIKFAMPVQLRILQHQMANGKA